MVKKISFPLFDSEGNPCSEKEGSCREKMSREWLMIDPSNNKNLRMQYRKEIKLDAKYKEYYHREFNYTAWTKNLCNMKLEMLKKAREVASRIDADKVRNALGKRPSSSSMYKNKGLLEKWLQISDRRFMSSGGMYLLHMISYDDIDLILFKCVESRESCDDMVYHLVNRCNCFRNLT